MRKKIRQLVRLIVLFGITLALFNNSFARAQQEPVVRCRFETANINLATETTLYLEVVDVVDLFAFQLELTFDIEQVEVYGEYPEEDKMIVGDFISADYEEYNIIDSEVGDILMAVSQNDPEPPKSGSGELASGYVFSNREGVVEFVFEEVILLTSDGEAITHRQENCSLTISTDGEFTRTPTKTQTPTRTQSTPGVTQTPAGTFTATPSGTAGPSLSPTPQQGVTATVSPTPQPGETATVSPIPIPSILPTFIHSPTPLPSVVITTETPYPSNTPTVTNSPTATATRIPEPTPKPFNSLFVVLCLAFCMALFAGIAVVAGVLWYLRQSR